MIGLAISWTDATKLFAVETDAANYRSLGHAAASLRKSMQASIAVVDGPAKAGSPPHAHKGRKGNRNLKTSILFAVDKPQQTAVIGPAFSFFGTAGSAHEFGGAYKQDRFAPRPFAGPALAKNLDRLPAGFAGSIGGK